MDGVGHVLASGPRAVLLPEPDIPGKASLFTFDGAGSSPTQTLVEAGGTEQLVALGNGGALVAERSDEVPTFFGPWLDQRPAFPLLVLPLRAQGSPVGAMAVSHATSGSFTAEESERAQHLADQAAVALEKLRLDREVASMSWEVLGALANAIDAKSTWTTGHSERVTGMSLAMGKELGLDAEEMDVLHRGGLLHDIGKIGVPVSVLDFDGPLTDEMRAVIQEHPSAGARILEPIRAFRPILPIVLYHHEQWAGGGYPEGLKGLEIPRHARLVAVADVFDAMVSARPYRPAIDADVVHTHIRGMSGVQFDPEMVEVLDGVMEKGWSPESTALPDLVLGSDRRAFASVLGRDDRERVL